MKYKVGDIVVLLKIVYNLAYESSPGSRFDKYVGTGKSGVIKEIRDGEYPYMVLFGNEQSQFMEKELELAVNFKKNIKVFPIVKFMKKIDKSYFIA